MKNLFFYQIETAPGVMEYESFNINKVVRTTRFKDKWVVFLDDLMDAPKGIEVRDSKGKYRTEIRRVPTCSEILLNDEEYARFRRVAEVL